MTVKAKETYTTTGTKTAIEVSPDHRVSMIVNGGASDAYSVEAQIQKNGDFVAVVPTGTSGNIEKSFTGPIYAVRMVIATNASGDIEFEVVGR